jgi:hypothetical protein
MATSGNWHTFLTPWNKATVFDYVYDPNWVGQEAQGPVTGAFRPLQPSDFAATISGLTVGAVAVTGITQLGFGLNLSIVTGSQMTIPVGAKSYSIVVESGSAYVNGQLIDQGYGIGGGNNGLATLNAAIVVGATGAGSTPSRVMVAYEL